MTSRGEVVLKQHRLRTGELMRYFVTPRPNHPDGSLVHDIRINTTWGAFHAPRIPKEPIGVEPSR